MKRKTTLFVFLLLTFFGPKVFAETYYSITWHASPKGFKLLASTQFGDVESCEDTASARRGDLDAEWKLVRSDCLDEFKTDKEIISMFSRSPLSDPYVYFVDENNFINIIRPYEVPPVLNDGMVWKWADALKKQGMRDVEIIASEGRRRVFDALSQAVSKISKQQDELPDETKKKSGEAFKPKKKKAQYQPTHTLVLANGQLIDGQMIKQDSSGIWIRMEDGTGVFFSSAELKETRVLNSPKPKG